MNKLYNKFRIGIISFFAFCMVVLPSYASESGIKFETSQLTSALTEIGKQLGSVLGAIAPIAIGITGIFLGWKYGVSFFKKLLG